MDHRSLINQINSFYKLAQESKANLDDLFKSAILSGDKETYLVFLDALGEKFPHSIEDLLKCTTLHSALIILSHLVPNLIRYDLSWDACYFDTPVFSDIKSINFRDGPKIFYPQYHVYDWINNGIKNFSKIRFHAGHYPRIKDDRIKEIRDEGDSYLVWDADNNIVNINDDNREQISTLFKNIQNKKHDDYNKLKDLLLPLNLNKLASYFNYTRAAREALGLTGNKYPRDLKLEGALPDGTRIKLISSDEAHSQKMDHRLYLECKNCLKWITSGKFQLHKPGCEYKHGRKENTDKIAQYAKLKAQMDQANSLKDKLEIGLVLEDFLKELVSEDRNVWTQSFKLFLKKFNAIKDQIAIEEYLGHNKHNYKPSRYDYGHAQYFKDDNRQEYKLTRNKDGSRHIEPYQR